MTNADSFIYIIGAIIVWISAGAALCHILPWDKK